MSTRKQSASAPLSCFTAAALPNTRCLLLMVLVVSLIPCGPLPAVSFDPDSVVFVEIRNVSQDDVGVLSKMGVDVDSVHGESLRAYLAGDLLDALRAAGYDITVLPLPGGDPGLRATGYRSYEALSADLQDLARQYADIFRIGSIGKSVQYRDIWVMKITDHPDVEEDEPEVSFIAAMHGDEPVGMELCMDLIEHLGGQYGTDQAVTRLIDETEIWILPLMNPDGYEMGIRYNADGYNLNREFPDRVSDPDNTPSGRPPEVAHVMNWLFGQQQVLSANFHTGTLVVNYPYDSDPDPHSSYSATPDDGLFREMSLTYARLNDPMFTYDHPDFENGIVNGVAWYQINGGMQDWHYVWPGCLHVTVELSVEKWPPAERLPALWNDNREAMLAYLRWSARGIRGIVTDRLTGQPLCAAVAVEGNDHAVYTDPDVGDYHRILLPGAYDMTCFAQGYVTKTVTQVQVGKLDATRVDVSLIPLEMDANDDGRLDLADAILVLQMVGRVPSVQLTRTPDINGDARTGLEEAIFLLRVQGES